MYTTCRVGVLSSEISKHSKISPPPSLRSHLTSLPMGAFSEDYGTNNTLTLSNNTFQNNSADHNGGALYAYTNNTLTLSENTFQNNSADYAGGALSAHTNNTLTLSNNTFQNILLIMLEVLFMQIQTTHSPSQTTHFRTTLLIMLEVLFQHIHTTHSPSQTTESEQFC